jgi:hypothetical protein
MLRRQGQAAGGLHAPAVDGACRDSRTRLAPARSVPPVATRSSIYVGRRVTADGEVLSKLWGPMPYRRRGTPRVQPCHMHACVGRAPACMVRYPATRVRARPAGPRRRAAAVAAGLTSSTRCPGLTAPVWI